MKAAERSQRVADLIAILTQKLDTQDDSPLCNFVAGYLAQVVGDARARDCPDDEAVREVEGALDGALRIWRQYESLRPSGTTE